MVKLAVFGLAAAAGVTACSGGGPSPAPSAGHQTYRYGCCRPSDLSGPLHPGQTFTLHWIVTRGPRSAKPTATRITLEAHLDGPYPDVPSLKAAEKNRSLASPGTYTGTPVVTTNWAGGHPVTRVAIPAGARPGYYNVVFGEAWDGGSDSGASIVRVTGPP